MDYLGDRGNLCLTMTFARGRAASRLKKAAMLELGFDDDEKNIRGDYTIARASLEEYIRARRWLAGARGVPHTMSVPTHRSPTRNRSPQSNSKGAIMPIITDAPSFTTCPECGRDHGTMEGLFACMEHHDDESDADASVLAHLLKDMR